MITLNQNAVNGLGAGTIGTTTSLMIFGNYATELTLLLSFVATFALVANSVVNKRRSDRELELKEEQAARQKEAHGKQMGDLPHIEGVTDVNGSRVSEES